MQHAGHPERLDACGVIAQHLTEHLVVCKGGYFKYLYEVLGTEPLGSLDVFFFVLRYQSCDFRAQAVRRASVPHRAAQRRQEHVRCAGGEVPWQPRSDEVRRGALQQLPMCRRPHRQQRLTPLRLCVPGGQAPAHQSRSVPVCRCNTMHASGSWRRGGGTWRPARVTRSPVTWCRFRSLGLS